MIIGDVDQHLIPIVEIEILGTDGRFHSIPAVLDTGCNLNLVMPEYVMSRHGLQPVTSTALTPVDGDVSRVPAYEVVVRWDGQIFETVAAQTTSQSSVPIVGMELCRNRTISIDMRPGGEVRIGSMEPTI